MDKRRLQARHALAKRRDGRRPRAACYSAVVLAGFLLTGCGRDMQDLEAYVADVKARQAPGIAPLPDIKSFEKFEYQAQNLRDPFDPDVLARRPTSAGEQNADNGISPDQDRVPEFLESFPLDALRMVGTLAQNDQRWALIRTPDATIERVKKGNYMGQNNGKITQISDASIELLEIIPDGMGGWRKRGGSIALSEESVALGK